MGAVKHYGCHSKPHAEGYYVSDGVVVRGVDINIKERVTIARYVIDHSSKLCRYDKRATDALCDGCSTEWDVEYLAKMGLR